MHDLKAELLRGLWYVAVMGADVPRGRLVHKTLLGEPLIIGRHRNGQVFALRDICPHRGMPLSAARCSTSGPMARAMSAIASA